MKIDIKEIIKFFVLLALTMLVFNIAGWLLGATIGGNMASEEWVCSTDSGGSETCETVSDFTYRGMPGYEGAGLLGSHLGLAIGFLLAIVIYNKFEITIRRKSS